MPSPNRPPEAPQQPPQSLRNRSTLPRSVGHRVADRMIAVCGSSPFLIANVAWIAAWIGWNAWVGAARFELGVVSVVVSTEALFLAIFVLIAQNRSTRIDELRAEVSLQVNTIAEAELTKLLQLVTQIAKQHGVDVEADTELPAMVAPTDLAAIESDLQAELAPEHRARAPDGSPEHGLRAPKRA